MVNIYKCFETKYSHLSIEWGILLSSQLLIHECGICNVLFASSYFFCAILIHMDILITSKALFRPSQDDPLYRLVVKLLVKRNDWRCPMDIVHYESLRSKMESESMSLAPEKKKGMGLL